MLFHTARSPVGHEHEWYVVIKSQYLVKSVHAIPTLESTNLMIMGDNYSGCFDIY